jgi:hypothetical protein
MPIDFACDCGKRYRVVDEMAGRGVKCKACGRATRVPTAEQADADLVDPFSSGEAYDVTDEPAAASASASRLVEHDALSRMMVNMNTTASNAAGARLDIAHYLTCYPMDVMIAGVGLLIGIPGGIFANPILFAYAGIGLWLLVSGVLRQRSKLIGGDVCPAVVIHERPYRIAVCTDLTTGHAQRPAILIMPAPLGRMTGGPPAVGQRLATVAFYAGAANADAWQNFDPTPIACATRDEAAIARVTASIPQSQWRQLDVLLARLPERKVGMYKLWLGTQNQFMGDVKQKLLATVLIAGLLAPAVAMVAKAVKQKQGDGTPDSPTAVAQSSRRPAAAPAPAASPAPAPAAAPRPAPASPVQPATPPVSPSPPAPPPEFLTARPPGAPDRPTAPRGVTRTDRPVTSAAPTRAIRPVRSPAPSPAHEAAVGGDDNSAGGLAVGDKIESKEKSGKWSPATVLAVKDGQVRVHYDGWSDAWDEWVTPDRTRVVPKAGGDFAVGTSVDVHEKRTRWTPGKILKKEGRRYFVSYDGWSDGFNEWVDNNQVRPRQSAK